jgi:cobalamin biosynthesis Mg chelatase CobN
MQATGRPIVDAVVSLTGFSLVGGPAYNDAQPRPRDPRELDVPYVAAQPVEFQTLEQWERRSRADAGRGDDDGRDPGARRRHRTDGLRRT